MDAVGLLLPETMTDGSLRLAAPRLEDAELHRVAEDDEMRRRFDSRRPATADEMRAAFQRWIDHWKVGGPNRTYLAWRRAHLVGGVEMRRMSETRADMSWWTYAPYRRTGLATRAAQLLCEAAAGIPGLTELSAHVDPDNAASRSLALRLGFVEIGMVDDTAWDGVVSTRVAYLRPMRRCRASR